MKTWNFKYPYHSGFGEELSNVWWGSKVLFYFKWNNNDAGCSNFVRYIIVYKNMSQMLLRQAKKPWFSRLFVHKKMPPTWICKNFSY